ncbi:hypothetical protein GQ44DRAFT_715516 [Phaeosphaeriaceae sp. PMI808]|nr:hypothetical protein GQ44DRAFT_715516 [Phaeosphaeriaceae sp. PMI808]
MTTNSVERQPQKGPRVRQDSYGKKRQGTRQITQPHTKKYKTSRIVYDDTDSDTSESANEETK